MYLLVGEVRCSVPNSALFRTLVSITWCSFLWKPSTPSCSPPSICPYSILFALCSLFSFRRRCTWTRPTMKLEKRAARSCQNQFDRYKPKWAYLDTFWYLDIYLQKYIQIAIDCENIITGHACIMLSPIVYPRSTLQRLTLWGLRLPQLRAYAGYGPVLRCWYFYKYQLKKSVVSIIPLSTMLYIICCVIT